MSGQSVKLLLLLIIATLLSGCGNSQRDLMTFLRKESVKSEWTKVCGDIPGHDLPGEGPGVCWTKYERANARRGKIGMLTAVRMAPRINDQVVVFSVPQGVDLDRGMRIKFDSEQPLKLKYTNCDSQSCFAEMPLNNELLIKLKYSKRMVIAVMSRYNKAYGYRIPMYRFVYAYNSKPAGGNKALRTASR
ncbi:MAG: invasion associated locus B family protein [Methyloligellaceae bacterium]